MDRLEMKQGMGPASNAALALFTHVPEAVLILNADGSVHDANPAAQWLGLEGAFPSFGEMTGRPWTDSFPLPIGSENVWIRRLRVTSASGLTLQVEATIVAVAAQGMEPLRCLCILRDVSPDIQRALTHQLAESRAKTAGNAAVMIWMTDAEMRFDWVNSAWLGFTGRTLGQELSHGWLDRVHPDDRDRCLGIHAVSLEARTPFSLDYRHRRHDGVYRWMLSTGIPRIAKNGAFEGYVGSCLDIQDRKETEDQLAERTRALRVLDSRREDFLAILSHELRNPLAPIANAAAILRRQEGNNPTLAPVREIIERQVEQLRRVISDLVDVSRITKGKIVLERERVVIGDAVKAAIDGLAAQLKEADQSLQLNVPVGPVVCRGDNARIVQALHNLIGNASKFSARGARIDVSVKVSADIVNIRIEDRGRGIRTEFMPRLFELFAQDLQTLARTNGGIGAGLTISRHIAELHGGKLEGSSDGPGLGSVFVFSLPLLGAEPVLEQVDPADLSALRGQRVLVIDDNPDMRESMRLLLELADNDVRCTGDGPAGLAALDGFIPQVVVCDIGLPGIDGYQVIARLRERLAGQPVLFVALTGYGRDSDRDEALESGFDAFQVKPVRMGRSASH